jgi:NAD(P)H-quinone oxidoreductase subunit 5
MKLLAIATLLPAVLFFMTSFLSGIVSNNKRKAIIYLAMFSSVLSILLSVLGGLHIFNYGNIEYTLFDLNGLGLSFRIDALSMLFFGMIALLGFIIVKYSINYLDGDPRQGLFMGRIAATIASVQLFVLSGNLLILFVAWVLTSLFLHGLLVFYKDRPRAKTASTKKFILARIADTFLLISFILLYNQIGSGSLETIFEAIKQGSINGTPLSLEITTIFLVLAALFKSAQFPFHGWLVEVMETPTPVSALLHAGVLNAGPFIIMRFAFVLNETEIASSILLLMGGLTALFASVVFLTQSSIKTALGYSSIAHMGFSLFICGTGAYSAAVLHIVAHSFYKAHSFLSSGSSVDLIRSKRIAIPERLGNPLLIVLGVLLTFAIYVGIAAIFGVELDKNFSLLAVGLVIVMSLTLMLTSVLDSKRSISTLLASSVLVAVVASAFFGFEHLFHVVLSSQFPTVTIPSISQVYVIDFMLLLFALALLVQLSSPLKLFGKNNRPLSVHLRNGLYINSYFDKLIGAYKVKK